MPDAAGTALADALKEAAPVVAAALEAHARTLIRGRPHEAARWLRRSIELTGARDTVVLTDLAECCKSTGDIDGARGLLKEVLTITPEDPLTLVKLAKVEECGRDFGAATTLLDRLGAVDRPVVVDRLARALRADIAARTGHLDEALRLLAGVVGPDSVGIDAGLALGGVLDRLRRHDEAFACWATAKRDLRALTGGTYDQAGAEECAAATREFFTTDRVALLERAQVRRDCPQPIFIVGAPRSGTTLMEQSLTALPNIGAGGELPYMPDLAELWMDQRHDANALRDAYLAKAREDGVMQPGKAWFTDKNNVNDWHLGLITLAFPEAPVIRLVRHPLDVVLSIFSLRMEYGFNDALDLESAATHYALLEDLVDDMLGRFPARRLTVRYEDVVGRQEETLRAVLEHVGEPWDARCLAFHENGRYAATESHAQVSEPLYGRSRGRYTNYLENLRPVLSILAPVMERCGYEV